MARRIDETSGIAAVDTWARDTAAAPRATVATAVRFSLQAFAEAHPGHSVEVRVPPFGAVQCIEGPRHTRGTPPNVVEVAPSVWLGLATGRLRWEVAVGSGVVDASGARSNLGPLLPVPGLRRVSGRNVGESQAEE